MGRRVIESLVETWYTSGLAQRGKQVFLPIEWSLTDCLFSFCFVHKCICCSLTRALEASRMPHRRAPAFDVCSAVIFLTVSDDCLCASDASPNGEELRVASPTGRVGSFDVADVEAAGISARHRKHQPGVESERSGYPRCDIKAASELYRSETRRAVRIDTVSIKDGPAHCFRSMVCLVCQI